MTSILVTSTVLVLLAVNKVTGQCEICPDGWIRFMNSCYFVGFEQSLNFVESSHFCRQHHANLLTIETAIENAFIEDFLKKTKSGNAWLGLSDIDIEGIWRWYSNDNLAEFTDWYPGQPDSGRGEEDCVAFSSNTNDKWHDAPCGSTYIPICEKQLDANIQGIVG